MNELSTQVTPLTMLQLATEKGASLETLQQLMQLKKEWEADEARKEYNVALAAFKSEGVKIVKDHQVKYGNTKYSHATLGNVVEQVTPALSKNGLSLTWAIDQETTGITVTCKLAHVQGHAESVSITAEADDSGQKNKIQQIGSTVTYLQRYTAMSILGLATYEDDDGRGAGKAEAKEPVVSEEQAMNIRGLLAEVGGKETKLCSWYRVPSIEDIPANMYKTVVGDLEDRRKK